MKNKLVIAIFLLLSMIILVNVNALNKKNMTTLNLKRIKSITTPSGGYSVLQGGGVTDKYIISVIENSKKEKNAIVVLNKNDYTYADIKGDNPILNRKYDGGKDVAFNSKTNELLILGYKKVYILDENIKNKNIIDLDNNYNAIAYYQEGDNYILAHKAKDGSIISILDSKFKKVSEFKIKHEFIGESLTVKGNNIYYACFDDNTKENVIFIYDIEGNKQNIYLIPKRFNGVEYGELKNISFDGNKMIFQFYKDKKINYYNQIINNKISDTSIKIKLNNKYEDNKYILDVYEDGNKIETLKNKGDLFIFNPKYTKVGTYKYILKQVATKKENVILDEEAKELIVDVKYNPVNNKYETIYNNITFNNKELKDNDKNNNSSNEQSTTAYEKTEEKDKNNTSNDKQSTTTEKDKNNTSNDKQSTTTEKDKNNNSNDKQSTTTEKDKNNNSNDKQSTTTEKDKNNNSNDKQSTTTEKDKNNNSNDKQSTTTEKNNKNNNLENKQNKNEAEENTEELIDTSADDSLPQILEVPDTTSSGTLLAIIGAIILLANMVILRKIEKID